MTFDDALIRQHHPALLAVASRALARREDAEDVVQETWISALGSVAGFEGRASLRTWLVRILKRRIADRYRSTRVSVALDEEQLIEWRSPEHVLSGERSAQELARAFDQLTRLEQRALLLEFEQCDRDQAAQLLGVSRGHLRVVLFRARHKLESVREHH